MDFIKREKVKVGTKLIVENGQLLTIVGAGGFKDEPVFLTVTKFGKREFTARGRYGDNYYFSNKTGKRIGFDDDIAKVTTEAQIAEIEAIIAYNRKVAAVRSVLDSGPGPAWDIVIEALVPNYISERV